jgi:hypothetical protein
LRWNSYRIIQAIAVAVQIGNGVTMRHGLQAARAGVVISRRTVPATAPQYGPSGAGAPRRASLPALPVHRTSSSSSSSSSSSPPPPPAR